MQTLRWQAPVHHGGARPRLAARWCSTTSGRAGGALGTSTTRSTRRLARARARRARAAAPGRRARSRSSPLHARELALAPGRGLRRVPRRARAAPLRAARRGLLHGAPDGLVPDGLGPRRPRWPTAAASCTTSKGVWIGDASAFPTAPGREPDGHDHEPRPPDGRHTCWRASRRALRPRPPPAGRGAARPRDDGVVFEGPHEGDRARPHPVTVACLSRLPPRECGHGRQPPPCGRGSTRHHVVAGRSSAGSPRTSAGWTRVAPAGRPGAASRSYRLRVLRDLGPIELVATAPRRGAAAHYYRARWRVRLDVRTARSKPGPKKYRRAPASDMDSAWGDGIRTRDPRRERPVS